MNKMKLIFTCLLFFGINSFSQVITTDLIYKVNEPQKKSQKIPVLIMLHGYGSNEEDLFGLSRSIDERFITFSLRAPFMAKPQGYSWYQLDFLPGRKFKYNYNEAKLSREKILSFISNACKAYKADSTQVFIMGFSQGAVMAYDIALHQPQKIKGVLALSGMLMEESKKTQVSDTKFSGLKIFIAHGDMDNVIEMKDGEDAVAFLKSKKINVSFKSYNMPHSISGQELKDIQAWLRSGIKSDKKESEKK